MTDATHEQAEQIPGEAALARALTRRWPEIKTAVRRGSPLSVARVLLSAPDARAALPHVGDCAPNCARVEETP